MRTTFIGLAVACTVAGAVRLLDAQDQPFRTGANYVRVDVFPTIKGVPVADLSQADFEILEDKVPQTIASFEHVVIRGRVPDAQMQEPRTVAESRDALANGRGRAFVVFLDPYHVEAADSTRIRRPLTNMLDRALGPDDLIGLYRPGFTPADLTFTPKHASVEGAVAAMWGQRDTLVTDDPSEDRYRACYPPAATHCAYTDCRENGLGIADDMIQRRRESRTLASLRELVGFLGDAREGRKAVLAITDGWRLFTPNEDLYRPLSDIAPGAATVPGSPRSGFNGPVNLSSNPSIAQCERDRRELADIDDAREIIDIEEDANRANVSFYPIDPRGLVAFDESPVANTKVDMRTGKFADPEPAVSPRGDVNKLTDRQQSLRALAESTDGVAVVQTNGLESAMQRVAADLSSYYLLGYNSSGKLDGKFHAISVRVTRPGVDVRARRGFRAVSVAEAMARNAAPRTLPAAVAAETAALTSAVASLADFTRERPVRLQAAVGTGRNRTTTLWATGEVSGEEWRSGGEVELLLLDSARQTRASVHATLAANTRTFRALIKPSAALPDGDYSLVARATPASGVPVSDSLPVKLAQGQPGGVQLTRRGPTTGNREAPTADARFRRTDRIGAELPSDVAPEARLLDRNGSVLPVPLTVALRTDPDGTEWQTVNLSLAPFAPGDYVIEMTAGTSPSVRTLVPFRIVP